MVVPVFHGQYQEDRIIREQLIPPAAGVFVDVGAGEPITLSNTFHFEQCGWTGLAIDADPRRFPALKLLRKCDVEWCAVGRRNGTVLLNLAQHPDLSTTLEHLQSSVGQAEVPAATLESLLCRYGIGKIDLLSIDVEGAELAVWRSMDWTVHRPSIVIVEWNTLGRPPANVALLEEFRHYPYDFHAQTPGNLIFALREELP